MQVHRCFRTFYGSSAHGRWLGCLLGLLLATGYYQTTFAASSGKPDIQRPEAPATEQDNGPWTNFSVFNGPVSDSLLCLHSDSNGVLWIGTENGVSVRSPAGDWQALTLADGLAGARVSAIVADPANPHQHWFATDSGASLLDDGGDPFDKSKHRWVTFGKREGLADSHVSSIVLAGNGELWFGLSYIDANNVEIGKGISVLNVHGTPFDKADDTWSNFTAANSNLPGDIVRRLATDAQGAIWIATQSGLAAYHNGQWTLFSTEQGLPSNNITAFLATGSQIWIATRSGFGLLDDGGTIEDRADDHWHPFPDNAPSVNDITSMALDAAGQLWLGIDYVIFDDVSSIEVGWSMVIDLHGTPLDQADDTWLTFNQSQISVNRAIVVSDHNAWFATNTGLRHLTYGASLADANQQQWNTERNNNNLTGGHSVSAIAPYTNDLVLLSIDSVPYLLSYGFTPHNLRDDQLLYPGVSSARTLAVDPKRRIWAGDSSGITVANLDDSTGVSYNHSSGLLSDQVNKIAIDAKGRAWIANGDYLDGGLNVLSIGDSVSTMNDDQWATFTPQNSGLPARYVTAFAFGKDNDVWVGTNGGVGHLLYGASPFDKGDDVWTTFTATNSGLANNFVRAIVVDQAGNAWMALAAGGVSVYTADGHWVTFTETDGLAYGSVNAVAIDQAGQVWLGTDGEGVSVLNDANTPLDKQDDTWTTYLPNQPLLSGYIQAITVDPWGQVWVGTFGGGLSLYSNAVFKQIYMPIIANSDESIVPIAAPAKPVR